LLTTRKGVFLAGCCTGPKDIPDSVCEASAAASLALKMFPGRKPKASRTSKCRDVSSEEPRVGVFVCRCGTNIASVVDVPRVVESASMMDGVVHAEENMFTCSEGALEDIARRIKDKDLNRVVIASCSPRTHEPLFRDTMVKAGLNPYLLEMANIRDQCSWVHMNSPEFATMKAIELVRGAVSKASLLEPLERETSGVVRAGLVIGGGPAGLSSARDLSVQGFEAHLVESGEGLGGLPSRGKDEDRRVMEAMVNSMVDVKVWKGTSIEAISGSVGDFQVTFGDGKEIRVGAIILAPGDEVAPGDTDGINSLDLDRMMETEEIGGHVVFIQCVGVRNGRLGCSRFCCHKTLEQAVSLATMGVEVSVLHRDIMSFQRDGEELYRRASELGVRFYRVTSEPQTGAVVRFDSLTDGEMELEADLVVQATGMIPSASNRELSLLLKVPLSQEDFLLEKHPKLAPVEFAVDGVFLAGGAQYPKGMEEAMIQGSAAAAKAASILSMKTITTPAQVCVVDPERCRGCGECERVCNYGAAGMTEMDGRAVSRIEGKMCKGCGLCAVSCPSNAIEARGFTSDQIDSQIIAILEGDG
jgi:heterodisulfide reductase subunit A